MNSLLTGMLVGSLALSVAVCSVAADWFASKENQVLPVQKKMERQIANLFSGAADVQNGKISNKYPEYTGEEMLYVRTDEKPKSTLYLRGTYADTYKNGSWESEKELTLTADQFSKYEDCQNLDPALAVANESAQKYLDLLENGSGLVVYGMSDPMYEIEYTGLRSTIAYLPYGPELDTMSSGDTVEGDYQFRKKKNDRSTSLRALGGNAETLEANAMLAELYYNGEQKFSRYDAFYEAYNQYVQENYLDVPEHMPALDKVAEQLQWACEDAANLLDDPEQANYARLVICNNIASMLSLSYSYQKDIPDSGSTDPVEFFLKEQNGGFCVHFASAGVLLLRKLGVPARYVSGYKVNASEFRRGTLQDDYGYECSVPDSDAHAWVEVYLDDYGWVPVEMTPSAEESAQWDKVRNKDNDASQNTATDQTNQEPNNQNPQETQPVDLSSQEETTGSDAQNNQTSNGGADGSGGDEKGQSTSLSAQIDWKNAAKVFLPIAAAVFVLIFIFLEKKRRAARWRKSLERAERSGRYSKAARMQNLRFYRWLVKHKKLSGKRMRDREYAENLQSMYPEQNWALYLQILQKAVYADVELTEEEYVTLETMIRESIAASQK